MKHFILSILFLSCTYSTYSQYKTIFADTVNGNRVKIENIAFYNEDVLTIETNWITGVPADSSTKFHGLVIHTTDAGKNWDTLRRFSWAVFTDKYKSLWAQTEAMFYFDEHTFCSIDKSGKLFRHDLRNKTCDTIKLLDSARMYNTNVLYFQRYDTNSAVVSCMREDSLYATYDKGKTWIGYRRLSYVAPLQEWNPSYVSLKPNGDVCRRFGYAATGIDGYVKEWYLQRAVTVAYKTNLFVLASMLPDYAYFAYPRFINDSVGFMPGHRRYFPEDNLQPEQVYARPVVYKTIDSGTTWEKVYEADDFIGRNYENIYTFGDTVILCYSGYYNPANDSQKFGYLISKDKGLTWEKVDLTNNKPTNGEVALLDFKSLRKPFLVYSIESSKFVVDQLDLDFVSVKEDNPFVPTANVYPNPASEFVSIDFDGINDLPESIEVFDILGNKSSGLQVFKTSGSVMINISALAAGVYTVRISAGESVIVKSFVVGR